MTKWFRRVTVVAVLVIAAAGVIGALAHAQQMGHSHDISSMQGMTIMSGHDAGAMSTMSGHDAMEGMQGQGMQGHGGMMHRASGAGILTLPGQDAFGAIQEVVRLLESDPKTDWSKVNLEALRQHLIDMNEVTLNADAKPTVMEGGLRIAVTGTGRTVGSIQRMVRDHAAEIEATHLNKWNAKTEPTANGVVLTVTASDPVEAAHIRGLGFIGIMASGSHHQIHHLAMARGEMVH